MNGYIANIEQISKSNQDFRRVLYTAKYCQLVVMSLKPSEEIGLEVHTLDQFFRVEAGQGQMIVNGVTTEVQDGFCVIVLAGTGHNMINTGKQDLKLYTLYSPPNHLDGTIHHTFNDAAKAHEHFDGKTTE